MKFRLGLIFLPLVLMACSSTPPVAEFPPDADPNAEITRVEGAIKDADNRQVVVFSPTYFEQASDSLDKAKEARANGKSAKDVLAKVALSEAYLKKANETADVSSRILSPVVTERENARNAEAPKYYPVDFSKIESDLIDATKDVEAGSTATAEKRRDELASRYSDIELQSIRRAYLEEARDIQAEADKEGARKLAPGTWQWADRKISQDDATVVANRHNTEIIQNASTDAKNAADRLLKIVRLASKASGEKPEEVASEIELSQIAQQNVAQKLDQTNSELLAKEGTAEALEQKNQKLQSLTDIDRKYEEARQQFSSDEAEVYKQGDKLLIRLKGLSFPKDQAIITVQNYPLLAKVENVIKEVGPSEVTIEGHTDSTGSKKVNEKLSTDRAKAVQDYLLANKYVEKDKVTAKGFGYSRPIASNKSFKGRAQNRRVDLIIAPERVEQ